MVLGGGEVERIGGMESVIINCLKKLNKKENQMNSKQTPIAQCFVIFRLWGLEDNSVLMAAESHALWGLI